MGKIAEIFKLHFPTYIKHFGGRIPPRHLKVANAIMGCRQGQFGVSFFECQDCGELHKVYNGCGNRHCPSCQQHKNTEWVEKQKDKLLPVTYFMVVFTVPKQVRRFIRSNQKICYSAMLKAASETLKALMKTKEYTHPGFLAVLHTWGRSLVYHPHIHFIVPGGGLSKDKSQWKSSHPEYLVNVEAASKVFRAKFYDQIRKTTIYSKLNQSVRHKGWNVYIKPVGNGEKALEYLARYVFKVAISDSRIIHYDDKKVLIKVKDSKTGKVKPVPLTPFEFIRRFLQHVLPDGFMKVRHYGFLSHNTSVQINDIRNMIDELWTALTLLAKRETPEEKQRNYRCICGSTRLKLIWHTWVNINAPPEKQSA